MIILDTNVISELIKPKPSQHVVQWLNNVDTHHVYTTTICLAEMLYGANVLASGKRKTNLLNDIQMIFKRCFSCRVLSFDTEAALAYGLLMAERCKHGRTMSYADGQIASIAISQHATLATRDVNDFDGTAVHVVNPFTSDTAETSFT